MVHKLSFDNNSFVKRLSLAPEKVKADTLLSCGRSAATKKMFTLLEVLMDSIQAKNTF